MKSAKDLEIHRSNIKDESVRNELFKRISNLIRGTAGNQFSHKWNRIIQIASDCTYFLMTTFSMKQTIGEEYIGLILVQANRRTLPSRMRILLLILTQVCGSHLLEYALKRWLENMRRIDDLDLALKHERNEFRSRIATLISFVGRNLVLLQKLFYVLMLLTGAPYGTISKWIWGSEYVLTRPSTIGNRFNVMMKLCLILKAVQLSFRAFIAWERNCEMMKQEREVQRETSSEVPVSSADCCSLCMDKRRNSTLIWECRHLFCWNCIWQWTVSNESSNSVACPLCKAKFNPSRMIPLQNYDPE